jgi:hypothetical protein
MHGKHVSSFSHLRVLREPRRRRSATLKKQFRSIGDLQQSPRNEGKSPQQIETEGTG